MTSERARYKHISETAFQAQVVDALHLYGWRVAHFRTSLNAGGRYQTAVQFDAGGYPDLTCLHPASGDLFVAELKAEYKTATPEQTEWLAWWKACGIDAYVWQPSDIDAVLERAAKPVRG